MQKAKEPEMTIGELVVLTKSLEERLAKVEGDSGVDEVKRAYLDGMMRGLVAARSHVQHLDRKVDGIVRKALRSTGLLNEDQMGRYLGETNDWTPFQKACFEISTGIKVAFQLPIRCRIAGEAWYHWNHQPGQVRGVHC